MTLFVVLVLVLAALVLVARAAWAMWRFARLDRQGKRHHFVMQWHRFRWRWLARAAGLAWVDQHRSRSFHPLAFGTRTRIRTENTSPYGWLRWPRGRWRADEFGWQVRFRALPKFGRKDLEQATQAISDGWGCHRVQVSSPRPGRLIVRGLRRDPLAEPLGFDVLSRFDGRNVLLGRDEWGQMRQVSLAGIAGSVIGGNPGRGKSQGATALAVQLAPVPTSQWYVIDGGGGADWSCWEPRARRFCTDNLEEARDVLEDAKALMDKRLANLMADLGTRNAWTVGPSEDYPLIWIPVDESSVFFDLETAKAYGPEFAKNVVAIRGLVKTMIQRGRKVMFHTTLLAQKCTGSSIPPDIRDLCSLRMCFGVTTTDSGIAVLGDDLRQFPSISPTGLQGDEHIGVCTARLKTGADPYVRLRIPYVPEDLAEKVAARFTRQPVGAGA